MIVVFADLYSVAMQCPRCPPPTPPSAPPSGPPGVTKTEEKPCCARVNVYDVQDGTVIPYIDDDDVPNVLPLLAPAYNPVPACPAARPSSGFLRLQPGMYKFDVKLVCELEENIPVTEPFQLYSFLAPPIPPTVPVMASDIAYNGRAEVMDFNLPRNTILNSTQVGESSASFVVTLDKASLVGLYAQRVTSLAPEPNMEPTTLVVNRVVDDYVLHLQSRVFVTRLGSTDCF